MIASLIEKFKEVKDFRKNQGKRHKLSIVLTIIILAILSGSITYKDMEQFIKQHQQKLIKLLKITGGKLPSYATIRRATIGVDPLEMKSIFNEWSQTVYEKRADLDWIAIDGKALKNTIKNSNNSQQNMLIIVSLFSQETSLVIRAESFEKKKGSEIKQVQDIVRTCGLTKKVFTLDALHCNQQTTREIIDSSNDYLVAAKKNQIKLYNRLQYLGEIEKPLSIYESEDASHGRKVTRKISVFDGQNVQHKSYPHLQSFIKVERSGFRGNKSYEQTVYYISSLFSNAEIFAEKICGHWLIENRLHWVKDVIFQEDNRKIRNFKTSHNLSIFTAIVLNLYRSLGFISIKAGQYWLGNNWSKIFTLNDAFG